MRCVLAAAALATMAGSAFAQAKFVEKKGVMEFTGQMIARPYSATVLEARGDSRAVARTKELKSHLELEKNTIEMAPEVGEYVVRVPAGYTEQTYADKLMATGRYEYVTPNWKVYPLAKPNDPQYANQWHHKAINSEVGWSLHTGGSGVTVAICDTGIKKTHEDLKNLMVKGFNAPGNTREVDGGDVDDLHGHGTHCAGDAGAQGNNGIGVAGVAWNIRLMPCKIVEGGNGFAFISDMTKAARWAVDNGARVASISFGGVMDPSTQTAGAYLKSKRGILLFAGGNNHENISNDWPDVTIVTSSNPADKKSQWAAFGVGIDVASPGEQVLSTTNDGGYQAWDGTSMATPLVAGLFALVMSYVPTLSAQQVENIIYATCDKIDVSNEVGNGRINVGKALLMARTTLTSATIIAPASASINYGTLGGGTLASLAAKDNAFYTIKSAKVTGVGQVAGVIGTFTIPNRSKLSTFSPSVFSYTNASQTTSGAIFMWNYVTSKYDLMGTVPVPVVNAETKITLSSATAAKYISTTNEVKVMYRALAQDTRNGGPASPFNLYIDRLSLSADYFN